MHKSFGGLVKDLYLCRVVYSTSQSRASRTRGQHEAETQKRYETKNTK